MNYTKLPVMLIGNYLWDKARGAISGSSKLPTNVWNVDQYTITPPIFAVNDANAVTDKTPYILYDYLYTGIDTKTFPLIREEGEFPVLIRLSQLNWGRKLSISSLPAGSQLLLLAKKEKLA